MTAEMMKAVKCMFVFACVAVACVTAYPTNITIEMSCNELSVLAKWNKSEFAGGNITGIRWNDPSCNHYMESNTHIWTSTNFSQCQSNIIELNHTIVQENTARITVSFPIGMIERVVVYNFVTKCTMLRSVRTPGGVSYDVTEKRIFGGNTTLSTDFNVRMDIYRDNSFNQVMVNMQVSSFDPVFVGIYEVNDNKLLKFVAHQCFATPTSNRDGTKYIFFDDKCPKDTSYKRITSSPDKYRFQINAFRFAVDVSTSVYLHCRLTVCRNDSNSETCTQDKVCPGRKRRAMALDTDSDEPLEEITVMSQKLTLMKPTCNGMTCPKYSSCRDLKQPVCRCGHGYVLNSKRNSCSNERIFRIYGLHLDMKFEDVLFDPYSNDFIKLAIRVEKQLKHFVSELDDNTIEGMKVVRARKGSVVVDVDVMYAQTSAKKDAHNLFLQSISKAHVETVSYDNAFVILSNVPTVELEDEIEERKEKKSRSSEIIMILSIVIPVAALITMLMIIAMVIRQRRCVPPKE